MKKLLAFFILHCFLDNKQFSSLETFEAQLHSINEKNWFRSGLPHCPIIEGVSLDFLIKLYFNPGKRSLKRFELLACRCLFSFLKTGNFPFSLPQTSNFFIQLLPPKAFNYDLKRRENNLKTLFEGKFSRAH